MSVKDRDLLANRYKLHEKLGAGAMGAVYRATDRLKGKTIALKQITLSTEKLQFASRGAADTTETMRLALATEFKNLASLRHPNIISVIDYGFDVIDPRHRELKLPYFTMDYLPEAQTILEAGEGKSLETQVDLLIQVLRALAYLHRRGILHRDIKPANVLVTTGGRVRLLDFGLSAEIEDSHDRIGTPAYMAPEVIRRGQASRASDLYAVGVLAYQLFSGQHPFQDNRDVLARPVEVDSLAVEDALAQAVVRLLEKSPSDRYPYAVAVITALQEAVNIPLLLENSTIRESFLQAATFVGREVELRHLNDALEQAAQGSGSAWLVGGESGVGKSRLLEELRIRALVLGAQVLRGQAVEGGGSPYQLWREPLRRLALSVELSDLEAGVLYPLIPGLEELLGSQFPEPPELEGADAQQRLVLTIAGVFQVAAQCGGPIVLILEDLHWSIESLEPLKALNRLVTETPILVIGSYRSDEQPDLPQELPGMSTLPLPRLGKKHIAELSVSMLGQPGSNPLLLKLLQKETEGNTLFLVETVRALAEEAGRLDAIGEMTLPEEVFAGGVQRIIQRRLERVPEEHRGLLKLAAVAGRALDLNLLNILASPGDWGYERGIETWLVACANLAVLEVLEGNWRFAHDKLRAELIAGLKENEWPALHQRVAEAYEYTYPGDPSYAAALMEHWEAAGEREKTAHYARRAGEYSAAQHANDEALRYLSRALALTPEDDVAEQYALYWAREEIYDRLGEREVQAADLDRLTALTATVAQQSAVALRYGTYHNNVGDYEAAIAISERAYKWSTDRGDSVGQAQAMINSGQGLASLGDYKMAKERYQRAYKLAQVATASTQIARAWGGLGEVAYRQGDYPTAIHYNQDALLLRQEFDDRPGQVESLRNLGQVANAQGEYERARNYYLQALQLSRQMGDRPHEGRLLLDLGRSEWRHGDHRRAEDHLQKSLTLAQATGDKLTAVTTLRNLGIVASQQGQYDKAIDYWEQSLVISQEIGDRDGAGRTMNNLGLVATYQGQFDRGLGYYEQSLVISQEIGDRTMESRTLNNMGEVAERQGQHDKALGYNEQSLAISQEIGDRYVQGKTLNNMGIVAKNRGDYQMAMSYFEQSLAISQEVGDRDEEGITLNNLGALAHAQSALSQAQTFYMRALIIRLELNQPQLLVEDWAGLALVARQQDDLETSQTYADRLLTAWTDNTTFDGTEHPMRALHFTYQVCQGLGLALADDVIATAAKVMQTYLDNQPDPETKAAYLLQPHHQALWQAWQARRE